MPKFNKKELLLLIIVIVMIVATSVLVAIGFRSQPNVVTSTLTSWESNDPRSLEEKVGQMFMFYYPGTELSLADQAELAEIRPGGVILMGDNIETGEQTTRLTENYHELLSIATLPPIISTDQEGGLVKRVNWDETPGVKDWGEMSLDEVCLQSKTRAETLAQAGINLNLAPVVDIELETPAFINNRTISSEPDEIISYASEFIECSQETGVATTAKHFPGHGATEEDSHFVIPRSELSLEDWQATHGKVFAEVIAESNPGFVMMGHLAFPEITGEEEKPATFSKVFIQQILREKYGHQGLVITDDMAQIHAGSDISHRDAIRSAILAGNDMILYINTGPHTRGELIAMTVEMVQSGEIPVTTIDDSVERILNHKLSQR